jgi:uncharacterized membrane protein YkoI
VNRTTRIAVALAVPTLALAGVTACSGPDANVPGARNSTSSTPSGTSTSGTSSSAATSDDGLVDAGRAALDEAGSGTLVSIEQESGGGTWEAKVITDDGTEHQIDITASDNSVARSQSKQPDADDRAENTRYIRAAKLDYAQAAKKITGVVDGSVTELGLDGHRGTIVWEADVRDAQNTKHSVRIDAGSGETVTNTTDTDD